MSLLDNRDYYKPFEYPWAHEAWLLQQKMHWLPEEVPLYEDVKDWRKKLTVNERNLLTNIFRFFTQADVDVASGYLHKYIPVFGNKPEISSMLTSFANIETIHMAAYSHLLDTVGMPESEYKAFHEYKEMKEKHDYIGNFNPVAVRGISQEKGEYEKEIALSLAVYSGFTEGLQLFSSFAILLNFPRQNKMKGMGQIITWSVRDESLHVEYMIRLFRTFIKENKFIWTDDFKREIYDAARKMVELEDKFIDLAFASGGVEGITAEEVKQYVRYLADRRLLQLGLKTEFKVKENPLDWMEEILNNNEHANFFETRATEYSKASLTGSWEDVFPMEKTDAA